MKKAFLVGIVTALLLVPPVSAAVMELPAGGYEMPEGFTTLATNPTIDLNHYFYYHWYIDDISNDHLDQADIVFHDIYNHRDEENVLNLYIMDYEGYRDGWRETGMDNQSTVMPDWSSWFHLGSWSYDEVYPDQFDVVFSITDEVILDLMSNGNKFILGIDPDCHYYGNSISVNAPVPEPATLFMLGAGLFGLAGASRKKYLKR